MSDLTEEERSSMNRPEDVQMEIDTGGLPVEVVEYIEELEQQLKTCRNDTLAEAVKAVYGLPAWTDIYEAVHVINELKK
jgi:hypothetical protein